MSEDKVYTEDELKKFVPLCIEGIQNIYEINRLGQIRNKELNKYPKGSINNVGYHVISLKIGKNSYKTFSIHKLVAITFLPNPNNFPIVDHIDRDRKNNTVTNLRWSSYSDNSKNQNKSISRETNILYQKINDSGNVLAEYSPKELKKLGYNIQKITECINNSKKYKEYFWRKSNKKLIDYINKFNIDLSKEEWKVWKKPGFKEIKCSKNGLFETRHGISPGNDISTNNYYRIGIYDLNKKLVKTVSAHRIIYECWSGEEIDDTDIIDHISTDRMDNRFCNLKKGTAKDNQNNPKTIQKREKPIYCYTVYGEFVKKYDSVTKAMLEFNNSSHKCSIRDCCLGRKYSSQNYFWCFIGNENIILDHINNGIYQYKSKNDINPRNLRIGKNGGMNWKCAPETVKNCILTGQPHPKTGYYYSLGLKNWETGEQIIPDVTPKIEEKEDQKCD